MKCLYFFSIICLSSLSLVGMEPSSPGPMSLLWDAARRNCRELVKSLLHDGIQGLGEGIHNGVSPVAIACKSHALDVARQLLSAGYSPNAGNDPALICAIQEHADIAFIQELIQKYRANIDLPGIHHNYPIFETVNHNYSEAFVLLLENGADIGVIAPNGDTLLHVIVRQRDIQKLHLLIQKYKTFLSDNSFFHQLNIDGESPLSIAIFNGDLEIIKMLKNEFGLEFASHLYNCMLALLHYIKKFIEKLSTECPTMQDVLLGYNLCYVAEYLHEWSKEQGLGQENIDQINAQIDESLKFFSELLERLDSAELRRLGDDFDIIDLDPQADETETVVQKSPIEYREDYIP